MKRLILIALTLIILGGMGYFATRNSHNVSLNLYGNFSIQFSLWMLIAGSFVSGWAVTELWQFFAHPDRFVRGILGKWSQYRDHRRQKKTQKFEDAFLLRDSKQVQKTFRKLDTPETPLPVRLQYLEQQRYEQNGENLLKSYAELRAQSPDNLQVLLPYLKLACELKAWDQAEKLSHEILRSAPGHPDALEGLRQFYRAQQDWVACVEQERELLKKFSGSLMTESIAKEHEGHLQKALRQDPKCLKNWSFRYLSEKRDKKKDKLSEAVGEASQLQKSGMFLAAAQLLKEAFERIVAPEILEILEQLYRESGADETILEVIGQLHRSRQRPIPASLLFAKLLYQNERLDEASHVLGEVILPALPTPSPAASSGFKKEGRRMTEEWSRLYHALRYLIALRQERPEEALQEAKPLLSEEQLLKTALYESN